MEIKAAVCRATHVPVGIESIDIDRPLGREVLVRTVATGVCHSDLHVVDGDGRFALERGIVLGHEGAGIVEAVGNTTLVRQAIESLAIRGTATIVGVLPPDAKIEFPWMAIRPECRVQTSRMGGNRFRIDIPRYLDFYRQGRLLLDEMVTRRGRLDDINDAFRAMKAGEVARTVLTFD